MSLEHADRGLDCSLHRRNHHTSDVKVCDVMCVFQCLVFSDSVEIRIDNRRIAFELLPWLTVFTAVGLEDQVTIVEFREAVTNKENVFCSVRYRICVYFHSVLLDKLRILFVHLFELLIFN